MTLTLITVLAASLMTQWRTSPEAHFLTAEERRQCEIVTSDDEAQRFIDEFRARRGADFANEVQKRAAIVDERLALGEVKASTTLRGRIVMLLGAPAEVIVKPIPVATVGNVSHAVATRKGGASGDTAPQPNLIGNGAGWVDYTFRYAANPALGIGAEGFTVVVQANGASGRDRLKYRSQKRQLDAILEAAARRMIH